MAEGGNLKRRELNGAAEGHSPVKKLKLEDDDPPEANPNTIEAVRHKNKEMALDLLEKNRRISFLTHKCESLFRQSAVAHRAFRCIQRQWVQLVDDMHSASSVLTVETPDEWSDVLSKTESLGVLRLPPDVVNVVLPEWFLAISRGDKEVDLKDEDEAEDDVPEATSEILDDKEKQLQQTLQEEQQRVVEVLQKLLTTVSSGSAQQLELKDLIDQKRSTTSQALELKEEMSAMKRKLADMQADLEAKEVERHRACRAYDRLKEYMEKQGKAEAAAATNGVKFENGVQEGGNEKDANAVQRSGEKKVTLVDPEVKPSVDREALQRLTSDNNILVRKLKEERQKVEVMRTELTRLRAFEVASKQEEVRVKEEFDTTVVRLQEEKSRLSDELEASQQLQADLFVQAEQKWKAQLDRVHEDLVKTKSKFNELNFKNTAFREKLGSFSVYRDQLTDMKSQHEALKREAERLREDLKRERARAERELKVVETSQMIELRETISRLEKERDVLTERVVDLQASLTKSGDAQLAAALTRESKIQKEYEKMQAERSTLKTEIDKVRAELDTANSNQDAFKQENDALVAEIEVLGKEVDSQRHAKKKVAKQMEESRHSAKKMKSELAKETDARLHATEELATVRLQVSSLKYVHLQQKAALEAAKELQKTTELELAELKRTLNIVQRERENLATEKVKADREAEMAMQMYKAESVHKQRQVLQDKSRPCEKCESYRKKEADYEKQIAALRASSSSNSSSDTNGGLSELERFELQDLRKQLKCSVCQDRHKNVIISKCSHLFCKECIDSNLRSRNRKCPTCKKMFGQDDVKSVWFT